VRCESGAPVLIRLGVLSGEVDSEFLEESTLRCVWKMLLVGLLVGLCAGAGLAQERPAAGEAKAEPSKDLPIPKEETAVTQHQQVLNGQTIHYTATAGNLLISKEERDQIEKPYHSIFYVAYTQDGAEAKTRPVTFLYNGGPGSATIWLEMGSVGPVRVLSQSPEPTNNPPYQVVPNEYSLLDKTDLVFIDAPGTGYSKPVGKGTVKDIAGVDQDLHAFTKFILRYITVNHRWNSPKYLFGESYGTTRSAGLSALLADEGVQLNGIVLLSSILNYNAARAPGLDNNYLTDFPTFAAIAYYHNKVPNKPADILTFVEQAREFARGPYAAALYQGNALSEAETDKIAEEMSKLIGLSPKFIKEANLRITATRFRKELLRDQNRILGRYDGRFEGPDADAAGENPSFDPSDTGINGAYVASFHEYLEKEWKFISQETYNNSGPGVNEQWDWNHRAATGGFGRMQRMPYVAGDLGDTIRKNPHLKVFAANGLFDLATPFTATEWELAHMGTEAKLRGNVEFGYYPSGHMVYLNVDALKAFRKDLGAFYEGAK